MVREGGQSLWGAEIEAVIEGDWRLMHNSPFYPWKLFNLANDSSESHDPGNRQGTAGGRLACD